MGDRVDLAALLDDLRTEQRDLRAIVEPADLDTPTPAEGWDVRDTISHLAGTDVEALKAARTPDVFVAELADIARDIDGFMTGQLTARRGLPRERFLADWQHGFDELVAAIAELPLDLKLPWYGPPMSPASFATARLMEYWAHGQDVADALGVERAATARLRHICHLGYRTRGFSFVVRGLPVPEQPVHVELIGPDGETWTFGDPSAEQRVSGTALDFCLLVTQRRHRDDTGLVAVGDEAEQWLRIAQCFAGPPGPGRPPKAAA